MLAAGLFAVALRGAPPARIAVLLGLVVAMLFTLHALGTPPTKGADLYDAATGHYYPDHPSSGVGEVVALIAIGLGLGGVLLSFTAD